MKTRILPHSFFDRPVLEVCKDLLGKFIVIKDGERKTDNGKRAQGSVNRSPGTVCRAFMITEIEAYDGEEDEACHARHGKTERNAPMFGKPGYRYVYLCYGMYQMLNIVTGPGGHPSAILIRGVEGKNNLSPFVKGDVRRTEGFSKQKQILHPKGYPLLCKGGQKLNGPGKLTKHLGITKIYNGKPASKITGLWIEDRGVIVTHITQKPRVGIDYAGKRAKKKWRFVLGKTNPPPSPPLSRRGEGAKFPPLTKGG